MLLFAFLTDGGAPKTGLTPSIDVWESDGTQVINSQSMIEISGGFYKYNFTSYDESEDYVIRADGGAVLNNDERYVYSSNDLGQVTEDLTDIKGTSFVKDTHSLKQIQEDTDEIQGKLPTNNIMGSSVKTDKNDEIDSIKTKTDNIPSDPTTETNATANKNAIITETDSIKALVTKILGLSQSNYKLYNPVYNNKDNLTSANIKIYNSSQDLANDTNPIAEYSISATYDSGQRMTRYQVTEV